MKKWLSMLLTVMLLVNNICTPIVALAEDAGAETIETVETPALFPEGYASTSGTVRVFGYRDTDGDGKTERVEIGTIAAGSYVYVAGAYPDGRWVKIAFAVQTSSGSKVVEGTAVNDNLTHVGSAGGDSGLSYNGHPLSIVNYTERVYATPTEAPAEEPEVEVTEEPAEEPEVEVTEAPAEEPEVEETEAPAEEPEVEETEAPAEEPEVEETEAPAEEPEVEKTEAPAEEPKVEETEAPTEEPEVEVTEAPTEEPEVPEVPELPEVVVTEEPEIPEVPEVPGMVEPEAPKAEVPAAPVEVPEVGAIEEITAEPTAEPTEIPLAVAPTEKPTEEPITTLSTIYNGSMITLTADPGVIPAGAELMVEPVDVGDVMRKILASLESGSTLVSFTAYDITLMVNGEVVQPSDNVKVRITNAVSTVSLSNATDTTSTIIYHIDGNSAQVVSEQKAQSTIVTFSVPHFSVYAVAVVDKEEEKEDQRRVDGPYQAKNNNGSITIKVPKTNDAGEYVRDDNGNIVYEEVSVAMDSAAFDFHIFAEDATLNQHTNGNIAANDLHASGAGIGNNQSSWNGVLEENYFGNSVEGLGNVAGGRIIIGSKVQYWYYKDENGKGDGRVYLGTTQIEYDEEGNPGYWMTITDEETGVSERIWQKLTSAEVQAGQAQNQDVSNEIYQEDETPGTYLDVKQTLKDLKDTSAQLAQAAVSEDVRIEQTSSDQWKLDANNSEDKVVVIDINAAKYDGKNFKLNINAGSGQTVIINVDVTECQDLSKWTAYLNGLTNAEDAVYFDCNLVWNFYKKDENGKKVPYDGQMTVGSGDGFFGVVMAPDAEVAYGAINGSVIGRKTFQNGNESHKMTFHPGEAKGDITVRKTLYEVGLNGTKKIFWFALFDDAEGKTRTEGVLPRAISVGDYETNSATFRGLDPEKTYYVFEIDIETGLPVSNNGYEVRGNGATVTVGDTATIVNQREGQTPGPEPTPTPTPKQPAVFELDVIKTVEGDPATMPEFTFTIELDKSKTPQDAWDNVSLPGPVTIKGPGKVNFNDIFFADALQSYDYYFIIKEVGTAGNGWTYDDQWELHVKILEDGSIQYDYKGSNNRDNKKSAEFVNTYTATPTEESIDVTKTLRGDYSALLAEPWNLPTFTFRVTSVTADPEAAADGWNLNGSQDINNLTLTMGYDWNGGESVFDTGTMTASFGTFNFTKAGTYTFTIKEDCSNPANDWTYDEGEITVVVDVKDVDGQLVATKTVTKKGGSTASKSAFVNTYGTVEEDDSEGEVELKVQKLVTGNDGAPTDVTFEIELSGDALETSPITVTISAGEIASFGTITFTEVGDYTFILKEKTSANPVDGFVYDTIEHTVVVTVVDNDPEDGELDIESVTIDGTPISATDSYYLMTITNKFSKTTAAPKVEKDITVEEGTLPDGEYTFTFNLTAETQEGMELPETTEITVTLTVEDGEVTSVEPSEAVFDAITFYKEGNYTVTISEDDSSKYANFTYAVAQTVTIAVSENEETGALTAQISYKSGSSAKFTNTYSYSVTETNGTITIGKSYEGDTVPEGAEPEFTFNVTVDKTEGVELASNTITIKYPSESATFNAKFTAAGTYTFTITENNPTAGGWTKDSTTHRVVVVVEDNDGVLSVVSTTYDGDASKSSAAFVNTYSVTETNGTITIGKSYEGDTVPEGAEPEFTFNVTVDKTEGVELASNTITIKYPSESATFNAKFTAAGTYTFTITENNPTASGWTKDSTTHTVVVVVEDNNGVLSVVSTTYDGDASKSSAAFVNTYSVTETKIPLEVTKTYTSKTGTDIPENVTFNFTVEVSPAAGVAPTTATGSVTTPDTEVEFDVDEFTFTAAGEYTFTIRETDDGAAGWTYDSVRVVKVTVEDKDSKLVVTKVDDQSENLTVTAEFENEYNEYDAEIKVIKAVEAKDASKILTEYPEFTFVLTPVNGGEAIEKTVDWTNGKDYVVFSFDQLYEDVYEYTLTEKNPNLTGWEDYDQTVHTVKIIVETDENGETTVTVLIDGEEKDELEITFTNSYYFAPEPVAVKPEAKKTLEGAVEGTVGNFKFLLKADEANDMTAVDMTDARTEVILSESEIKANVLAAFGEIKFKAAGDYKFYISEEQQTLLGWTFDKTVWTLEVKVSQSKEDGSLTAEYKYTAEDKADSDVALFTNKYEAVVDVDADLGVTKRVENKGNATDADLANRTFTFSVELIEGDETAVEAPATLTITGTKTEQIHITFKKAGTYTFKITEQPGTDAGYTYDKTVWTVTYEIKDTGHGTLQVANQSNFTKNGEPTGEQVHFINEYTVNTPTPVPTETPAPSNTPDVETTTPGVETTTPGVETTTPGVETTTPAVETTTPAGETETPAVETETPAVETTTPDVETETPAVETTTPDIETETPDIETETPDTETETPADETDTPAPVVQMTTLTGTKTWVDNNNADGMRPATIEVVLYANGVAQPNVPVWTNTDTNVWTYTFTQLPMTNAFGTPIVYTVAETPVEYYIGTQDGLNFTNTIVEKEEIVQISVSGVKTWEDNGNARNTRPESITIELLQNGVAINTAVVTAADDWTYTFTDLPESDGYGNNYLYTVRERSVAGYYAVYDGMNVTNVLLNRPYDDTVTFFDGPVPRGLPNFSLYTDGELSEMFVLFDYGVPLFGMLLGTGLEIPMYPFVFTGIGVLAIVLVLALGRKKKED